MVAGFRRYLLIPKICVRNSVLFGEIDMNKDIIEHFKKRDDIVKKATTLIDKDKTFSKSPRLTSIIQLKEDRKEAVELIKKACVNIRTHGSMVEALACMDAAIMILTKGNA